MTGYGNDYGNQGQLLARTSQEALDARNATPDAEELRHRSAGYWPESGTVLRVILLVVLLIVVMGGILTLLNK
jgi:hypothetical protein